MAVFELICKLGRMIRLTEVQWVHIEFEHKELSNQMDKIIQALKEPDFVYYAIKDDNYHYYKYFSETPVTRKYLLVIVKHLRDKEGFVITAFFISRIREKGKEVIYGEKDSN
jgi:hypothetical protein